MKNKFTYFFLATSLLLCGFLSISAQDLYTTNLVTESKERVLRIESIVPASPKDVWKAFASEAGLKKWIAPVVALDLRIGGSVLTQYDRKASIGSPGTIHLGIVNYLEGELMTYKVNLTSAFPPKVRAEDQNLQEIIQLSPCTNGTTRVISSMVGWGTGKEWDDTYGFFAKGNVWSYQQLVKCFSKDQK